MSNFNFIAPWYDGLVKIIFGKYLLTASITYFDRIYPGARILIAGGGTGEMLIHLDALDMDLHIHFVDSSAKMVERASHRTFKNIQVHFEVADIREVRLKEYDFIISAFFLDCFDDHNLEIIVALLEKQLAPGGEWLFTDFVLTGKVMHRILIKSMYLFFMVVSRLQTGKLPDYDRVFTHVGFQLKERRWWCKGLVESRLYCR